MRARILWSATILAGVAGILSLGDVPGAAQEPAVRAGFSQSLRRETDAAGLKAQLQMMGELLRSQAEVAAEFEASPDHAALGRQLEAGEVKLAVVAGIEYGWLKQQGAKIRPLCLACNESIRTRALLLVRSQGGPQSVAELKGKPLAMARGTKNHCYLFLDKTLRDAGQEPAGFLTRAAADANADGVIEAVLEGEAEAAVVDGVAWDVYRARKPGRAARLCILKESCHFPTTAIIYAAGATGDRELARKVRDGLTTAHDRPGGMQRLVLLRITRFMTVPDEYEQVVTEALKEFPKPVQPADFFATRNTR